MKGKQQTQSQSSNLNADDLPQEAQPLITQEEKAAILEQREYVRKGKQLIRK